MEHDTVTLPAYWASALVNGDFSGMDDAEEERCNAAVERLAADGWNVVAVADDEEGNPQEPRFTRHYHLYDPGCGVGIRFGEVLDYTILRSKR